MTYHKNSIQSAEYGLTRSEIFVLYMNFVFYLCLLTLYMISNSVSVPSEVNISRPQ